MEKILIISTVMLSIWIIVTVVQIDDLSTRAILVIGLVVWVMLLMFSIMRLTKRETQKQALDYNPYKKVILYELRDSVVIAVDSIYVLKEVQE